MRRRLTKLERLKRYLDSCIVILFFGVPYIFALKGGSEGHIGHGPSWGEFVVGLLVWIGVLVLLIITSVVLGIYRDTSGGKEFAEVLRQRLKRVCLILAIGAVIVITWLYMIFIP